MYKKVALALGLALVLTAHANPPVKNPDQTKPATASETKNPRADKPSMMNDAVYPGFLARLLTWLS